ncbi:MAG: methionine--tRNA ligase, partial [Actinomycetota bacterium]
WYITTAIPYVNAKPHIGFALEIVLTDALARYRRLKGYEVRFLTGSDDNSLKNVQAAQEKGIDVRELVERNTRLYEALRGPLNLSFDDFIRTSVDARHLEGVQKLWKACSRSGDVYKKPYRGLYCVGCEQFYAEKELNEGLCPEHGVTLEWIEEENYFFRLSRYRDRLERLIRSDELRILPETRKNEVLSFIRAGLEDFSISRSYARSRGWGVPVPDDPGQVMYVWFDALGNYITALDWASEDPLYHRFWLHNPHRIHVIGKGIIRFHAVYWPAMLLSAGVPLPSTIFVHGYLTVEGKKMSKSLGNTIDPVEWAGRFGTDPLRYFLLRHIRATDDADFSLKPFLLAYNADLADQLGNLVSRVAGMLERYFGGQVPSPSGEHEPGSLRSLAEGLPPVIDEAIERFAPWDALAALWDLVAEANRYVVRQQPWELDKRRGASPEAEAELATTLYNLAETLRLIAHHLAPFLPGTAAAIAARLGLSLETGEWKKALRWGLLPPGAKVRSDAALFPKIRPAPDSVPSAPSAAAGNVTGS